MKAGQGELKGIGGAFLTLGHWYVSLIPETLQAHIPTAIVYYRHVTDIVMMQCLEVDWNTHVYYKLESTATPTSYKADYHLLCTRPERGNE